jgi:hypothetical protein
MSGVTFKETHYLKYLILFHSFLFLGRLPAQPLSEVKLASNSFYIPVIKTIFYRLGDKAIPLSIYKYGNSSDIVCINLHDNEFTSVQAARSVLEEKGGVLIKLDNNRQRVIRFRLKGEIYAFDPNRVFSRTGIAQTLTENSSVDTEAIAEIEKFAIRLLNLIPDETTCIVALHNNSDNAYSIKSYLPGKDREKDACKVHANNKQDIDDIILTTDSILFKKMADSGYNSIWQHNERAKKDGSLSVWYGEKNKRYINIETQHGRLTQYIEMIRKLLDIIGDEKMSSQNISAKPL